MLNKRRNTECAFIHFLFIFDLSKCWSYFFGIIAIKFCHFFWRHQKGHAVVLGSVCLLFKINLFLEDEFWKHL